MKYCSKCGHEMMDEAVICVNCGCMTETHIKTEAIGLNQVIKVFLIFGTITACFMGYLGILIAGYPLIQSGLQGLIIIMVASLAGFLLPLAWCLPMIISGFKKMDKNQHISTGYKICVFLFINMIAGILLFCRK